MNDGCGRVKLMDSIKVLKVPPSSEYWYQKSLLVCPVLSSYHFFRFAVWTRADG
jgi:hypothetical protein